MILSAKLLKHEDSQWNYFDLCLKFYYSIIPFNIMSAKIVAQGFDVLLSFLLRAVQKLVSE